MTAPYPIAVLISGGGTTLQNLVDQINLDLLNVNIVQVIASRPNIVGIDRARKAGLAVEVIDRRGFASLDEFSERIWDLCRAKGAKLVCMAGYLQLLKIPADFAQRVINIHPALLPAFGGKGMYGQHVHEAVIEYGAKVSGCTVHFVDDQYDHGPIIAQQVVEVKEDDTPESLAARVFRAECAVYPEVIEAISEGRIVLEGRRVKWQFPA